MAKSYHTSSGIVQTKVQAKFAMKFFEYSDSKHNDITPNVFEYDKMERPALTLSYAYKL